AGGSWRETAGSAAPSRRRFQRSSVAWRAAVSRETACAFSASRQKSGAAACSFRRAARRSRAGRSKVPPERLDARVDAPHALAQGGEEHQVGVCPVLRHAWLNIAEGVGRGERPACGGVVVRTGSGCYRTHFGSRASPFWFSRAIASRA